ncbi:autoinducer binding domain-containing protein [Rhizobium sp. KVB221]|uniref:Autoinducer binding domain-containing protein n=1 Tax=Rhizobium setariae TaxID=2801340 RepID=A0A936YNP5_9HYPH|nr:LuxR C-terminal-related transcriptional regulator [Rhizobium setariae]MBL0372047.1 autoinducer binding domain-containing protein [Rhizobium setariae]
MPNHDSGAILFWGVYGDYSCGACKVMRNSGGERHQHLYRAIAQGNSKADLALAFFELASAFGFSHASLMIMPAKTDRTIGALILESTLPLPFFQKFDQVCPAHNCQYFHAARSSILPVTWSHQQIARQFMLMNAEEPPVLALYREYGLTGGILFPLSSIDGARHLMRFDGDREMMQQEEINDLAMLGMHIFEAYDRARYPLRNNPCGLTERELDVVRWSATGKTSSEIGQIMSLSDHTINAYMNNAFKKLDCVNRTQLVAKALRMRIIS